MKNKTIYSAVLTLCLLAGGSAMAQRNDHRDDRNDHNGRDDRNNHSQRDDRPDERRNDRNDYKASHNDGPRGAGPRHDMRKGQRLPSDYRSKQYVVNDWRGHHLRQPPRGQHWVQTGGDYVLVGIATGIIAEILLNN